jgi:hypothetical protein
MALTSDTDLVIRLAHELAVVLEMNAEPAELREVWGEAIETLRDAELYLKGRQIAAPPPLLNVLRISEEH